MKTENPNTSFVAIVQATKSGDFRGEQSLTHNCDFIIKVAEGVAYQRGRFAPASEIKIFEGAWYKKNKNADLKPHLSNLLASLIAQRVNLRSDVKTTPEKKSESVVDRLKAAFPARPIPSNANKPIRAIREKETWVWWDNEETHDLIL